MKKTMVEGVILPEAEQKNFDNLMEKDQKVTGSSSEPQCGFTPNGDVAYIPQNVKSDTTRNVVGIIKYKKQRLVNNSRRGYIKR